MDSVLAIRPFVPARDHEVSKAFYMALGFTTTFEDAEIAILKIGSFSFTLQNFFVQQAAENCMVQMLVRDADRWWQVVESADLVAKFGVREPRAPTMQSWGMKVGFLFDPSGVLWHVAEVPF